MRAVKTRTLLILAVVCGFVILLAGGIQLLRIASQDDSTAEEHAIGERVQVGDLTVVVDDYAEADDVATVTVTLGGVADPDGSADFRLVVTGESIAANSNADGGCGATTVAEQQCVLEFGVADAPGGSRFLLYRRGDERARWQLST